jgi:hypothetical protein
MCDRTWWLTQLAWHDLRAAMVVAVGVQPSGCSEAGETLNSSIGWHALSNAKGVVERSLCSNNPDIIRRLRSPIPLRCGTAIDPPHWRGCRLRTRRPCCASAAECSS